MPLSVVFEAANKKMCQILLPKSSNVLPAFTYGSATGNL